MPTLLLWLLILNASLRASESHNSWITDSKDSEVVRPVRLHTVHKRNAETLHRRPETVHYSLTVGGQDMEMQLEKNKELITADYTETYYREDGTQVTTTPDDIDDCYYQGKILNDSDSFVSLSTCEGLKGYFRTSAQKFLIEPLSKDDEGDHTVTTMTEQTFPPAVCGVTNTTWNDDFEPPTSRSRSRSGGVSIAQQQKYLELYLVVDNRMYLKMKGDQLKIRERIFEIVNFVNMVYKPMKTFVALVGLEIWSNGDLISVTPPAGTNLNNFMRWRNSELMKRRKHDNAHLISGINFEGATVGLAYIGTLCSGHSVGVVQDHNNKAIAVGATLAHEMGHNLGMNHDDSSACACAGDSCIMAASLSWNTPRSFSSCSSNFYEKYLTSRSPSCLLNKPDFKDLMTPAICGNGFLETGEQCDCGTVEECTNPCCNATTCTLTQGSQCFAGECCENCKLLPRSRECRTKHDECDIAEYCDGESVTCPEDVFAVNGLPCDQGLGYCHNGQCPQRPDQCVKMYGAGASQGTNYCFSQNTRGVYYAYCKRPSRDQYIPCQKPDVFCGKLFCQNGNANPNYGRMVKFGKCKASFFSDYNADYGQVDTGTKCGDGKVCSQNECVELKTAYRNVNCSDNCPGNSVCNHRSECQCEPGWVPPDCDSKDADFSPLSSGALAAIIVTVLLILLGVIAAAVGLAWKKRQSSSLPVRKPAAVDNSRMFHQPTPSPQVGRPKGAPPPPPPAGNNPKPGQSYASARQALRPVPPPKV